MPCLISFHLEGFEPQPKSRDALPPLTGFGNTPCINQTLVIFSGNRIRVVTSCALILVRRYPIPLCDAMIASGLSLTLTACATTATTPTDATSVNPLTAHGAWKLNAAMTVNGNMISPTDTHYRLQFVDDSVSVLGGCNRMSGRYAVSNDKLEIQVLASTPMACPEPGMKHDIAITRLFGQSSTMHLMEAHSEQLRLETPAGDKLTFTAMPLE